LGLYEYCFKSEFETGEVVRQCAREYHKLWSEREKTVPKQTCGEFSNGVKVCYCKEDLCNGAIKQEVGALVGYIGVGVMIIRNFFNI